MTTDIVIASAASTPVGSLNGVFANVPAHDLGAENDQGRVAHAKVTAEVLAAHAIQGDNAIKAGAYLDTKLRHTGQWNSHGANRRNEGSEKMRLIVFMAR